MSKPTHPCPFCGAPVVNETTPGGTPIIYCRNGGKCRKAAKAERQQAIWKAGSAIIKGKP